MEASLDESLSVEIQRLWLPCNLEQKTAREPESPANPVLSSKTEGERRTLLDLPTEIQLEILDFITAPTHLKSLCLTCKAFYIEATIRLYRQIVLPVNILNEDLFKSLNAQNRGLAHVKTFEMYDSGDYYYDQAAQGLYLWRLLRVLTRDALTDIQINTKCGVSSWIDQVIAERQGRLLNFVSHASGELGITPYTLPQDKLFNITSFAVHLESTNDIVRYLSTFSRLRSLTNLTIKIHYWAKDGAQFDAVSSPDVVRFLLHGNAQSPGVKGKVTSLLLDGFDFEYCAQDLLQFLHFNPIRHLAFVDCKDTWKVYQRAAKKPLNLLSFVDELFATHENQEEDSSAIDSFLQGSSGLRELKLTYWPEYVEEWENCKGVAWNAIQPHSDSLRLLDLDDVLLDTDCWKVHRSIDAFRKLCTSLHQLEQLAIRPPNANRDFWTAPDGFIDFLDCLKHLKSLVALKLTVRPDSLKDHVKEYDFARDETPTPEVTKFEMQALADVVFSTLHDSCPRLSALVLYPAGSWNGEFSRYHLLGNSLGYMRAVQVDQDGKRSIASRPVPVDEIKYHEPCSDVLYDYIAFQL